VTSIAPDGSRTFVPWAAVAGIKETKRAFCLIPAGDGTATVLPKRGLASPGLLPELRAFLQGSAGGNPVGSFGRQDQDHDSERTVVRREPRTSTGRRTKARSE
jgi:YcxB-like protein